MGDLSDIPNRENIQPTEAKTYEPLNGRFKSMVVSTKVYPSKDDVDKKVLEIEELILEGEHEGRKLKSWFGLGSIAEPNEVALGILSSLGKACGLAGIPEDSYQLHDKAHMIDVKPDGKYTKITRYLPLDQSYPVIDSSVPPTKFDDDDLNFG